REAHSMLAKNSPWPTLAWIRCRISSLLDTEGLSREGKARSREMKRYQDKLKKRVRCSSTRHRRCHKGDIMSAEKRSALMGRIRNRDTSPELAMFHALKEYHHHFERHAQDLPGRPDFVFREERLAIFVDGDFWHGWRFSTWRHKLSEKWEAKI